jgi:hypothetical protein
VSDDLARLVEALDRRSKGTEKSVAEIRAVVGELAEAVATIAEDSEAGDEPACRSWFDMPLEASEVAVEVLGTLAVWLAKVFVQYPDGAAVLKDCWTRHPAVVEELLWLRWAWEDAYHGDNASSRAAGDWHERQRPGAVQRIGASIGTCSLKKHVPGGDAYEAPRPRVPGTGQLEEIAEWWAGTGGRTAEPRPLEDELAQSRSRM